MLVIELSSYLIRAFSLGIRLSANILAGHLLVDIIADLIAFLNNYLIDLSFLVLSLLIALYFLEIGVACLQAYVFLLLVSLYLHDAVVLHLHV
jgi:F0F1-type ATP synthase membrane subunit a